MESLIGFEPRLYGVVSVDGVAMVSSRALAAEHTKRHDHVLRDIEETIFNLPKSGEIVKSNLPNSEDTPEEFIKHNFKKSTYKDDRGRKQPEWLLGRDGYMLVTMGYKGKKAMGIKLAYINRFNEMEKYIASRDLARMEYPHLTEAIKELHDPAKHYHFSNEADMINRIVLGMSAKEFRLRYGLSSGEPLRDHLTLQQIDAIVRLQKADEVLATMFPDYKVRKAHLEQYYRSAVLKAIPAMSAEG